MIHDFLSITPISLILSIEGPSPVGPLTSVPVGSRSTALRLPIVEAGSRIAAATGTAKLLSAEAGVAWCWKRDEN
jgi:hypothetical protein